MRFKFIFLQTILYRIVFKRAFYRVKFRQAIIGTYPYFAVIIFAGGVNDITWQPVFLCKNGKAPGNRIEKVKPGKSTDPDTAVMPFVNIGYVIIAYAVGTGLVLKPGKRVCFFIEQVEPSVESAYPQITVAIFQQRVYPIAADAIGVVWLCL
jgi:hypothetical protein